MSNAYVGVPINSSSNNTVANSTITSNTSNALFLANANNSKIFNNTFISTVQNQQLVVMLNQSTNNLFALDNFTQTSAAYLNDSTLNTNFLNATVSGKNQGNFWFNILNSSVQVSSGGTASSISGYDIGASGSGFPYNITNSQNGIVGTSTIADNAPLVTTFACGSNLSTTGATYQMGKSISATGSTCFNVTAANVTLNCNGFSITGTNATNTYGVYSSQLNTTVKNCLIQNFTYAIYFNGSSNGTISNDTLLTTQNTGYALYLANASNNNTVANITAMSNAYVGVGITASSNNTVANSTITSNTSNALFLANANNSNIFNNTFISTAQNQQLVVMLNQSTNNLFALDNFTQTSAAYLND